MEQQRALVCRQVMMTNSRRLVVPEVHVAIDLVLKFMVDEGCRGFREQRHVVAVIESQRCTVISRKHSSYTRNVVESRRSWCCPQETWLT